MSHGSTRKPFRSHSERWQREAIRDGVDPKRWDRWTELSEKSRANSDPRKYAQGQSVPAQQRELKVSDLSAKINQAMPNIGDRTAGRIAKRLPSRELNKLAKMDPNKRPAYIRKRAAMRPEPGQSNPYWYHAKVS